MGFLRQGELYEELIFGGLLGLCVGDALGVPVEFSPRETLAQDWKSSNEKQLIESKGDKEYEREHNGNLSIII